MNVNTQNAAEVAQKVKAGELPGAAKSLAEAMARVWGRVRYVQKDKRMQSGASYTYVSDAALIDAIRPELVIEGITFAPVDMQLVAMEVVEGRNNKQNRVVLRVTNRFTHAPSAQTLDVVTFGEGMDVGDKATNKAMTAAAKYCLRQSFCVETGDDPDDAPSHDQQRAPAAVPPARQPQPAHQSAPAAPARDNLPLRAKYSQDIATAKSRDALAAAWRAYDADVKGGKLGGGDKAALDPLFADRAKEFPAAK